MTPNNLLPDRHGPDRWQVDILATWAANVNLVGANGVTRDRAGPRHRIFNRTEASRLYRTAENTPYKLLILDGGACRNGFLDRCRIADVTRVNSDLLGADKSEAAGWHFLGRDHASALISGKEFFLQGKEEVATAMRKHESG